MHDLLDNLDGRGRVDLALPDHGDDTTAHRPVAVFCACGIHEDGTVDEERHQSPSWLRMICSFMTSQSSTGRFIERIRSAARLRASRPGSTYVSTASRMTAPTERPSRAAMRLSFSTCWGDSSTWVRS